MQKGTHVKTLTKRVGQIPRRGVVERVDGATVEVRWEDGHRSILSSTAVVRDKT